MDFEKLFNEQILILIQNENLFEEEQCEEEEMEEDYTINLFEDTILNFSQNSTVESTITQHSYNLRPRETPVISTGTNIAQNLRPRPSKSRELFGNSVTKAKRKKNKSQNVIQKARYKKQGSSISPSLDKVIKEKCNKKALSKNCEAQNKRIANLESLAKESQKQLQCLCDDLRNLALSKSYENFLLDNLLMEEMKRLNLPRMSSVSNLISQ